MKNVIRLALSALSIVVLSACGGGSDSTVSQTSTGFSVEGGLVQKGPLLAGQRVTIAEVNPLTYNPAGLSYDLLTKDNMGGFSSSGINFTRQHIQTLAQGMFFNEITGKTVNDTVSLQAYGDLTVDRLVNVNVLTTLAALRVKALVTDKTQTSYYRKFSAARTQAQKEVLAAFGIYNSADLMGGDTSTTTVTIPANFNEMDLATDAQANKMLVALSALVVQIGTDGVGISQFITQFQADLADNGLIDASAGSSTLQTRIAAASKALDLSAVATNLTAFYANSSYNILTSAPTFTAAQLTPWVDSSGGVDLVLDKFKSSSTTAAVGTVSKASLAYVVGSDDASQCLSVGSVSIGATGALYIDGATTARTTPVLVTKGQSVVLGLTASAAGTYAGFIQRSAATSGACPSTTPTTGTTRLQKYSITASSGTSTTVPGAPTIGAATAGDASASIAFTVPSSNGGATITGYTASCVSGTGATASTKTGTSTSSPITVSSLTNGTAYSCTVKATNSAGDSAASGAVSVTPVASTPVTVPGAPTIGAVTAGAAQASVAFTAPSSNGGATISSYSASCAVGTGTPVSKGGSVSPIVVTGLTNGSTYSCSVTAANGAGTGLSSGGVSVMPVDGVTTVPTKPTLNSATAGSTQITVAFTKAATGGTATSFTASCTASGVTKTTTGTASPLVVTGLTAGTAYTCTVKASNAGGSSAASTSKSATPTAATTTVSYSTPSNFADVVAKSYTPSTTLTASSTFSNRGYYMISNAATASTTSNYAAIGSTYSTAGYTVTAGTLASTSTYNDYLTKTMQLVTATDGKYRIDSYLHPNNSIDVESATSTSLKFKNNFGKTSATDNGFVTFDVTVNATTKAVTLKAQSRYKYSTTTSTTNGSTVYTGSYTLDSTFTGSGKYIAYASGTYALSSTATSVYLYVTPFSLGVPTFMNPNSVGFVDNGAAPFLSKVTTTAVEGTSGSIYPQVKSTYQSQVASVGTNAATKSAATTMLATIKSTVEASGEKLRYSTDVYTAYRDAALATKLVSDSIADGTPGQNLVPYVYFTNEMDTSGKYHPMMVVVSYGNQASPNGLKDVPHPPGSGGSDYVDATVTRYSNLENYIFTIPMKDYGQVTDVTTNVYPSSGTKNLWYDMFSKATTSYVGKNVYTWADSADNGILVNGAVMFPAFNNSVVPSHLSGELSASGCHVGQGGGGPHCHADGYQSGQGLGLYNDADYVGKTHPPLLGFGYDGIALFARYRSSDTAMLGNSSALDKLDDFGAHNHDSIGYHYHAHTVSSYSSVDQSGATTTQDMYPLMKGAYIGVTSSIPFFRTNSSFATNKYLGGTVAP